MSSSIAHLLSVAVVVSQVVCLLNVTGTVAFGFVADG